MNKTNNIETQATDWETKGREYLAWVADNEKELRVSIMKTVTYDRDIFDDIWSTALLKVYKAITERHVVIDNLKYYVYISVKWEYVNHQNRLKRDASINIPNYFDIDVNSEICEPAHDMEDEVNIEEERFVKVKDALKHLRAILVKKFGKTNTDRFFHYYKKKSTELTSYSKVAQGLGISPRDFGEKMREMKTFISLHPDFSNFKIVI